MPALLRSSRVNVVAADEKALIREVIENWVVFRDAGNWDGFRTVWHDDGWMTALSVQSKRL